MSLNIHSSLIYYQYCRLIRKIDFSRQCLKLIWWYIIRLCWWCTCRPLCCVVWVEF